MIPEFGLFALIMATSLACLQVLLPSIGLLQNRRALVNTARPLAYGQFFFASISALALFFCLLNNDFSLQYVAQHSNSTLPFYFKIGAFWGAHEGSLLLWDWQLCAWMAATAFCSARLPDKFMAAVLICLGALNVGLLVFLVGTSNPFLRLLPNFPIDGNDLNPLLQDIGLIIHPPLLYMGYVGLCVPWAFAMAGLLRGRFDHQWLAWLRPWVLAAWGALTLGITLGSWWAYYELGWGGWWFWDAVENASFMPWLIATALLHSLRVAEQKRGLYAWVALLAILAFFLSLLGTFLIRSGILSSVHAFAVDPTRGVYLLIYLSLVIGSALLLFVLKAPRLQRGISLQSYSREAWLMVGTLLLCVSCATILLGTLFPLLYESITHDKVSVGFPYFNAVFVPIITPLFIILPLGVLSRWNTSERFSKLFYELKWPALLSLGLSALIPWCYGKSSLPVSLGISLGSWVLLTTLVAWLQKGAFRTKATMALAHIGLALVCFGVVIVSYYSHEQEVILSPLESTKLGAFELRLDKVEAVEGPNYLSHKAHVTVFHKDYLVTHLYPEKRFFLVQEQTMTETAIWPHWLGDIYVALGDSVTDNQWALRIHHKPLVRWIWAGGLLMTLASINGVVMRRR